MPDSQHTLPARRGVPWGVAGLLGLVALAAALIGLRALALIHGHSLNSIDGALQTWFALDHFARGEALGSAFQSYLGITMVLALVPLYLAFGKTLLASSLAAQIAVVASAMASAWAIIWLLRPVPPPMRAPAAIIAVFLFFGLGPLAAAALGLAYPLSLDPGVSLRPWRGALPFLVLPVLVWSLGQALAPGATAARAGRAGLGLGLAAGAGLLWSNDAGIPLVLALAAALVLALHRYPPRLAAMLAGLALGTVAAAAAILLAVTHGAPAGWLGYNFRDVAGDQFWFFGPWQRSARILGPADLAHLIQSADPLGSAGLVLLAAAGLIAALRRLEGRGAPLRTSAFAFLAAALTGTALIPQIGGHVGAEYNAITFMLGAAAPAILWQGWLWRQTKPLLRRGAWALRPGALAALAALAALGLVAGEALRLQPLLATAERSVHAAALGFRVTPAYAADLAAMARLGKALGAQGVAADRLLLSAYMSPLDIAAGARSPTPYGALIHALGEKNRAGVAALLARREVAAVTTIAPDYSGWAGWLMRAQAPIFAELYRHYRPIARGDQQVLWVPRAAPGPAPAPASCRVTRLGHSRLALAISAPAGGLAVITLTRAPPFAQGRGGFLVVREQSPETAAPPGDPWADFPRYGIANAPRARLLAPLAAGRPTRLTLTVLNGGAIGTATCTAATLPAPDLARLPGLPQGIERYLAEARP
ncbi:MAG: hypothetical protein KatS3mg120_1626 [Erythrobacter sp.]|nr:MAG: hypothetical protein KatS3mg120_1626 [Erythrobacter sp.]